MGLFVSYDLFGFFFSLQLLSVSVLLLFIHYGFPPSYLIHMRLYLYDLFLKKKPNGKFLPTPGQSEQRRRHGAF